MFRYIKWFFQRIIRGYSNKELWNLCDHLGIHILKRLKAFRKHQEKYGHGYPMAFGNWNEKHGCAGLTREEYYELKDSGKIIGGGMTRWLATIDEMIFAFEFGLDPYKFDFSEEATERADKGMEYFKRFFWNLWD